jgi:hypothetical protein
MQITNKAIPATMKLMIRRGMTGAAAGRRVVKSWKRHRQGLCYGRDAGDYDWSG